MSHCVGDVTLMSRNKPSALIWYSQKSLIALEIMSAAYTKLRAINGRTSCVFHRDFWQTPRDLSSPRWQSCVSLSSTPMLLSLSQWLMNLLCQSPLHVSLRAFVKALEHFSLNRHQRVGLLRSCQANQPLSPWSHTVVLYSISEPPGRGWGRGHHHRNCLYELYHWSLQTLIGVTYVASKKDLSSCTNGAM